MTGTCHTFGTRDPSGTFIRFKLSNFSAHVTGVNISPSAHLPASVRPVPLCFDPQARLSSSVHSLQICPASAALGRAFKAAEIEGSPQLAHKYYGGMNGIGTDPAMAAEANAGNVGRNWASNLVGE